MKRILLAVLFLSLPVLPARAEYQVLQDNETSRTVTGTIDQVGKNSIDIVDESDHLLKRLIYFPGRRELKAGDRVRARYNVQSRVVEAINRLSPVERKSGQNAGYLFKK